MMKGISPIIATVLLIAVAVAIGVLVSTWITRWTLEQTQTAETATCATTTIYDVSDAAYNTTTQMLTLIVTNKGSSAVYNFTIEAVDNTTAIKLNVTPSYSPTGTTASTPLLQGRSFSLTANMSTTNKLTSVKVTNTACGAFYKATTTITNS
jgi:flagellin-like protein